MRRLHYGWVVVAASSIALFGVGGGFYGFGVFFKPLQAEFGLSRATTSMAQMIFFAAYGASLYISGRVSDRLGPRTSFLSGAVLGGLGFGLSSRAESVGQLFGFYVLAGLGIGTVWATATATVQRWFVKSRGLAVALTSTGIGLGMTIFLPLLSYLIYAFGWRTSYMTLAVATAVFLGGTAWFMVRAPADKGLVAYGAVPGNGPVQQDTSWKGERRPSILDVMRSSSGGSFVIIFLSYVLAIFPINVVAVHFVAYATDNGVTAMAAAVAFSLMGMVSVPGRIIGGMIADRIGWKYSMVLPCILGAGALLWLIFATSTPGFYAFSVLWGLLYGMRIPQLPGLIGYYLDNRLMGELTGLITGIGMAVGGLGAVLAGKIFDISGSYSLALAIGSGASLLSGMLVLLLKAKEPRAGWDCHNRS